MGERLADQSERRAQHQREHIVEGRVIGLVDRLGTAYSRVVDEDVDAAPAGDRPLDDPPGRRIVGQVEGNDLQPIRVGHHLAKRRQLRGVATDAEDRHARRRQASRRREADAAAGTGDDRDAHLSRLRAFDRGPQRPGPGRFRGPRPRPPAGARASETGAAPPRH